MSSSLQNPHHRRSIRLAGHECTRPGAYFLTISTDERRHLFGVICEGEARLNELGRIAYECWLEIPIHFPAIRLDEFTIMPNHIHGIIVITDLREWNIDTGARHTNIDEGSRHAVTLHAIEQFGKPRPGSIPTIVRSYKSAVTNKIHRSGGTHELPVWQRNYWEHCIRDDDALARIREYIRANPWRWNPK